MFRAETDVVLKFYLSTHSLAGAGVQGAAAHQHLPTCKRDKVVLVLSASVRKMGLASKKE